MHKIKDAKALEEYRLWVRFSDGVEGKVNLSDLVGRGVFTVWNDFNEFKKVTINPNTGTVTWPGGLDLCPYKLYQDILKSTAKMPRSAG